MTSQLACSLPVFRLWVIIVLTCARPGRGLIEQSSLDPTIFGYCNNSLTTRVIITGNDLYKALQDVTISTIILNGALALTETQSDEVNAHLSQHIKPAKR
jgi:hypothetical protein